MSIRSDLEKKIGHVFHDAKLCDIALTHSSLQGEFDNERMEFLGDRVVGLIISDALYNSFPDEDEGILARRYTALVCESAFVTVARNIGLAGHIRLSVGEARVGGAGKDAVIGDAMEALIGAIFLDVGFDGARDVVLGLWDDVLKTAEAPPVDPKSALQEWAQGRGFPLPEYKLVSQTGADHSPVFEIEVSVQTQGSMTAKDKSKRAAEKNAATLLLQKIEESIKT